MAITRKLSAICLSLVVSTTVTTSAFAESWKGWNIHKAGYPNTEALDVFVDKLKDSSDIKLKMYHSGVLGNQPDAIEQVRIGALQVGNFSMGPIGPIVPEANVLSLPFLFRDIDHMYAAMDGAAGEAINAAMEKKGLISVGWFDSGARSFYNSVKPINTPADVQGLKVRVMNNDLYSGMIKQLGGNPSPIAYAEVYQSLKTGVVDAAENGWPQYESTGHHEVAKYYSLSQHLIIPECICINAKAFNKLSAENQEAVRKAGYEAAMYQRELWKARAMSSREKVMAAGTTFNEIANKKPFMDAMDPVYEQYLAANPEQASLVELIRSIQ